MNLTSYSTLTDESNAFCARPLAREWFGPEHEALALPDLTELAYAMLAIAQGSKPKALVPLADKPLEIALVRRGPSVAVSYYSTEGTPDIYVLDRTIPLDLASAALADALDAREESGARGEIARVLAERIRKTSIVIQEADDAIVERSGGVHDEPSDDIELAFGFTASFRPSSLQGIERADRADIHALLFPGQLWAYARGHRRALVRGPILLPVQRMVSAMRALVEAQEAGRPAHVRLRHGAFAIGVRLEKSGEASVTLSGDDGSFTVTSLDVARASLPVFRLANELLRALCAADRTQARNLRVRALRDEVRRLRRMVRERMRTDRVVNRDPERVRRATRATTGTSTTSSIPLSSSPTGLRFSQRWALDLDELDANATFFCGDRFVIATPRRALALSRDDGRVIWVREGLGGAAWMLGRTLMRQAEDGTLELSDIEHGESYGEVRITARGASLTSVLHVAPPEAPPVAVVSDGRSRLGAIDLRTGEPRWRLPVRGVMSLERVGRLVVVLASDGTLSAVDAVGGETLWQFRDGVRFRFAPAIASDTVVVTSGEAASPSSRVYGIDLLSGEPRWTREVELPCSAPPVVLGKRVALSLGPRRHAVLTSVEPRDGTLNWMVPDPGLAHGASALVVDRSLIVNSAHGLLTALELGDGSTRWQKRLSDVVADDVPRKLEPVLRGGALFVPSGGLVHVIRPADGHGIGDPLKCELVPDVLRVDERGWVYVGEESGHLAAFAPAPRLMLVHSA
jgi:outer membrane protein assembly factor BamB